MRADDVPTIVPKLKMVGTAQARAFAHPTQLAVIASQRVARMRAR
jgi:hypothetical protein